MKYLKTYENHIEELEKSLALKKIKRLEKLSKKTYEKFGGIEIWYNSNFEKICKMIDRDCQPWLAELKEIGNLYYRGFEIDKILNRRYSKNHDDKPMLTHIDMFRIKSQSERKPLSTDSYTHKTIDDYFLKEFGWRARSQGVFATPEEFVSVYGEPYVFFPVGEYEYLWSKQIYDLFSSGYNINDLLIGDYVYQTDNLKDNEQNEVMFNCNKYILVPEKYRKELEQRYL